MEFRGADFIKKVQIKQEAEELRHRIEELEAQSMDYDDRRYKDDLDDDYYNKPENDHLNLQDLAINEQPEKPKIDKKKLAFLIFFLAIVFIFTVILIRFFMNYSTQNDLLDQNKIDEAQIEQKFEQIVSQTKEVLPEANSTNIASDANVTITEQTIAPQAAVVQAQATQQKEVKPKNTPEPQIKTSNTQTNIAPEKKIVQNEQPKKEMVVTQKIEKKPEPKLQPKPKTESKPPVIKEVKIESKPAQPEKKAEPKRDMKELFGLKETQKTEKKIEQKAEQKTQEKPKQTQTKNTTYIQVGSFSKEPDQKLFDKLKKAGYSYQTREIKNGNSTVTKVIVGPIGEENANQELTKIKQNIAPSAFISK